MTNDVRVKDTPAQWIASVRGTIPQCNAVGSLIEEVSQALGPLAKSGMPIAIWHDKEYRDHDVDAEAGILLKQEARPTESVQVRQMPETTVASLIHEGAYNKLPQSYNVLLRWVKESGYEVAGPLREIYLQFSTPVKQDDDSYVTEIQAPIEKSAGGGTR